MSSITPTPRPDGHPPELPMMMPHEFIPPNFGELLEQHLDALDWSKRHFAELVGTSHTQVRRIIEGDRTPPDRDELLRWAEKLGLKADARDIFVRSGTSARAKRKADTSDYVRDLERKLAKATAEVERAETRLTERNTTMAMAIVMIDQLVTMVRKEGGEIPESVVKAVTQLRKRVDSGD